MQEVWGFMDCPGEAGSVAPTALRVCCLASQRLRAGLIYAAAPRLCAGVTQVLRLGMEAMERLVHHEPLRQVHEYVFGLLALESEPVDPRL